MGIAPTAGPAKENFMFGPAFSRDLIILYSLSTVSGRVNGPLLFGFLSGESEAYFINSSQLRLSKYFCIFSAVDMLS